MVDNEPTRSKAQTYDPKQPTAHLLQSIVLSPGPHLFIDDFLIERDDNLTRRVNSPIRDPAIPNPIVTGKEDGCFQPYLTVLRDLKSGRFRIWYGRHTDDFNGSRSKIGYLESNDGIHWERPHRVLIEPSPIQFGVSVIDDGVHSPNPAQRYKYGWHMDGGLRIAVSPDGLTWTMLTHDVVVRHNHDINGMHWDPLRKRYVATVSFYVTGKNWSGQRRVTAHAISTDLLKWSEPWFVVTPEDGPDDGETQFYAMDGYLRRGDLMIGMVKVLHDDYKADDPPDPRDAYGIGYTTLAWTRDGETWVRDRTKFLDRNPARGTWDHAHTWIDEQVPVDEHVYLYYGGYACGHKVNRFEERQIGLAKMLRDRYVSRDAGTVRGTLLTPSVIFATRRMTINAKVDGELRIRLLDSSGKPLRGFDWRDCAAIHGDGVSLPVQWKGNLAGRRGKPSKLEFGLRNGELYGFDLVA